MNSHEDAPVVIDAITLRGIGSYLQGARLDLKPLTLLCGSNGSGKSTWLRALNALKDALALNRLPYGFAVADWSPDDIQLTNAFFHLAYPADITRVAAADDPEFGSPGTIGLQLRFTKWHDLIDGVHETGFAEGIAWQFLNRGICNQGLECHVRIAHPTYWDDHTSVPELKDVFEITLNGLHVIRMTGERDAFQRFEEGYSRPRRSKPYTLSCSRSFLSGRDSDHGEVLRLATISDLNAPRCETHHEGADANAVLSLLQNFELRFCELMTLALRGYFYIGAVRVPNLSLSLSNPSSSEVAAASVSRYVGPAGENAWVLERSFADVEMRGIREPRFQLEDADVIVVAWREEVLSEGYPNRRLRRLMDLMKAEDRAFIERIANEESKPHRTTEERQRVADAINPLLDRPDLFEFGAWGIEVELTDNKGNFAGYHTDYEDPDIQRFVEAGIESLDVSELRLLNFLLICDAFSRSETINLVSRRYALRDYLSAWLMHLLGVGLNPIAPRRRPQRIGQWNFSLTVLEESYVCPTPYLLYYSSPETGSRRGGESLARLVNPCFGHGIYGASQPPRQLSAGFHQVFPILVQLGLMRPNELIGVENPEVHLHPSLQLKVTETLIKHVNSGRRIIVETHSDLVLRRVIRAILEEAISQSQVNLCFVGLQKRERTANGAISVEFRGSSLEPITVDSHGRIANWPKGFLDEDVLESQRLMDIMYGSTGSQDDAEDANDEES